MKIKAVLFDLGGTLISTASVPEIFRRILASSGYRVTCEMVAVAHDATRHELDPGRGQCELGMGFWMIWNSRILRRLGITGDVKWLSQRITDEWWRYSDAEFYPDVASTLSALRERGIKIGVVTNSLRADYEQLLNMLSAGSMFDVVVGTDTCMSYKPDKGIFEYALNRFGLKPEEALFVGNEFEADYEGATKAGIKSLLIDRNGEENANAERIVDLKLVLDYLS